jgi:hypothetical protein
MNLISEIAKELFSMFMADAKLSFAILALVGMVAYLVKSGDVDPLLGGAALLFGCLAILAVVATIESNSSRRP